MDKVYMNYNRPAWKFYKSRYKFRDYYLNRIISRHITMPLFGKEAHIYFYGGKFLHNAEWANQKIAELINGEEPFMVSRFGNTELHVMNAVIDRRLFGENAQNAAEMEEWWKLLYTGAGFFPFDSRYQDDFGDIMLDSISNVDILGTWNRPMEDYHLRATMKNASITVLRWLEPWYSKTPWTRALEGKKVLVIHPFEKSIREQYEKKKEVFPNGLLPDFNLDVLKAVQSIGDNNEYGFGTWFDALEYMKNEAMKRDFEVAIIGCGAYGMPLASMLKKEGKKTIHLGGVTQCLFGIKGSRWVNSPIDKIIPMNENWIYPDETEIPLGAADVEGGCYWK
ncbi:hypothetical protein SAMN04487928_10199 [Butyrivibrio proteoclasticus]|uniref:Uncharacterized protein n=1 Tax=Butyrivibrio proteoclasticus TaxID=43305 RepID=A0A1I5PQM2_9FIRM|nr:hypothetical protein [Butyrivibrio proteoclasticus]SFP36187.1 hypothetical protein SAMN04487928_10199 [Butyrivibrio proteoclasticus]